MYSLIVHSKAGHSWAEIQPVQQGLDKFQSIYGQADCPQVNPLNDLGTTSLSDF